MYTCTCIENSALHALHVTSKITQQTLLTFLVRPRRRHSNGPLPLGSVSEYVTLVESTGSETSDVMDVTRLRHLKIIVDTNQLRHSEVTTYSVVIDDTIL